MLNNETTKILYENGHNFCIAHINFMLMCKLDNTIQHKHHILENRFNIVDRNHRIILTTISVKE